eukprot:2609528-Lingulodinium_polyedra.AAC.1
MFRPAVRCVLGKAYRWLARLRAQESQRCSWCPVVWLEVVTSAVLLPYCETNLQAPWARRV